MTPRLNSPTKVVQILSLPPTARMVCAHRSHNLSSPEGEEWLPVGRMDVTVDQDDRALGVLLYREHLRDIILAAKERGVPVLLTTVATNLRNHLDNGTPGQPSATEQATLRELNRW